MLYCLFLVATHITQLDITTIIATEQQRRVNELIIEQSHAELADAKHLVHTATVFVSEPAADDAATATSARLCQHQKLLRRERRGRRGGQSHPQPVELQEQSQRSVAGPLAQHPQLHHAAAATANGDDVQAKDPSVPRADVLVAHQVQPLHVADGGADAARRRV